MTGKGFVRKSARLLIRGAQLFVTLLMLYLFMTLLLGLLPVNKDFTNAAGGIEILVITNGVHADLVMPVQTPYIDWRKHIPTEHFRTVDPSFRYVAIGWGDKGFYINTPEWSDLTASTALRALFMPSPTAMHVSYYRQLPLHVPDYVRLQVTAEQYQALIAYILPYFKTNEDGRFILIPGAAYSHNDNFYEAFGDYHLFNTSNNWTNRGLKAAGIRAAVWSPLDRGIMYQLGKIKSGAEISSMPRQD